MAPSLSLPNLRQTTAFFYYLVLLAGLLFYLGWGIYYHNRTGGKVWTDIGVYSVLAVMMGFGLIGTWLYRQNFDEQPE